MFQARCKCSKHVADVSNALQIFRKHVANVSSVLLIFKTRFKCFKHFVNVSTVFYSQRVANSRKKII